MPITAETFNASKLCIIDRSTLTNVYYLFALHNIWVVQYTFNFIDLCVTDLLVTGFPWNLPEPVTAHAWRQSNCYKALAQISTMLDPKFSCKLNVIVHTAVVCDS